MSGFISESGRMQQPRNLSIYYLFEILFTCAHSCFCGQTFCSGIIFQAGTTAVTRSLPIATVGLKKRRARSWMTVCYPTCSLRLAARLYSI